MYREYCVIPWTGFMSLREHPVVGHYEPFALQKVKQFFWLPKQQLLQDWALLG